MERLLLGAISMASLIAAMFFLRFWRHTADQLFLWFAVSFLVEGINRAALGLSANPNEAQPFFYFVRFLSYLLIVIAIVAKNLERKKSSSASSAKTEGPSTARAR
jgi:uncharacterized membrane protein HdeD (DUF308 family)